MCYTFSISVNILEAKMFNVKKILMYKTLKLDGTVKCVSNWRYLKTKGRQTMK